MVKLWCSASDRIRVSARRRRMSTGVFQTCDAGRARVHLPSEAGAPDMAIGRAAAVQVCPHSARQTTSKNIDEEDSTPTHCESRKF
jgi:hypothetical protein